MCDIGNLSGGKVTYPPGFYVFQVIGCPLARIQRFDNSFPEYLAALLIQECLSIGQPLAYDLFLHN